MNSNLIADVLNRFPEVAWDRWSGDAAGTSVFFGWIEREDGRADFLVINFDEGVPWYFCTSSAKFSEAFGHRLGFGNGTPDKHHPCRRVEADFCAVEKVVRLEVLTADGPG